MLGLVLCEFLKCCFMTFFSTRPFKMLNAVLENLYKCRTFVFRIEKFTLTFNSRVESGILPLRRFEELLLNRFPNILWLSYLNNGPRTVSPFTVKVTKLAGESLNICTTSSWVLPSTETPFISAIASPT